MDLNEKEFKIFGKSMEYLSLYYGIFLIIWGLIISFISSSSSMTSYIPTFVGLLITIFSSLSLFFPDKKKVYMHIVVLFGLITTLGGLDFFRGLINGSAFTNFWADLTKIIMLITGSYFVYLCVKSFRFARKIKEKAE